MMGMPVTGHHVWGRAYGHDSFQVVQTNNSESSWREKEKTTFYCKQTKDVQTCQESKKS
jgi:hypothetical protein